MMMEVEKLIRKINRLRLQAPGREEIQKKLQAARRALVEELRRAAVRN